MTVDLKSAMIKLQLRNDTFKLDIVIIANFQEYIDENSELFMPKELMKMWPFIGLTMIRLNVLFLRHYFYII